MDLWKNACKVKYPGLLLAICTLLAAPEVNGQDPQFSQFYAAPLYLNPAFAGSTNQGRAGTNYRNQWPAVDANYTTLSAFADLSTPTVL